MKHLKRLYIALIFMVISISLCIFEQYTINSTYKVANQYINTAISQLDKNDYNAAKASCKQLNDYWGEKQKYMTAMIDHGSLDEASITISNLEDLADSESDDLGSELITAKNQIKSIYENQKITFGNVF